MDPFEKDETITALKEARAAKTATLHGVRLFECPVGWISQETHEIMRAIFLVEQTGRLLWPGEWADQPAWLVQAFEIYGSLKAEWHRPKEEANEQKKR